MLVWALKYWRIIGLILAVLGGLGSVVWYGAHKHSQGYQKAMQEVATAQAEANMKVTQKKRKIKHETQGLDRDAIIRELCASQWVRNPEYCPK